MALNSRKSPILFGDFEVDLASGELRRQGVRIKLQEQPFQALAALVERPGEVLTRRELQQRIWPEETTVDFDRGLNKAINRLREALGDDADEPLFIETLPQRGYRFLAKVETAPIPSPPRIESIAVLPLENLSSNPGDEYFSDGMTDELIGEIARIGSLRVISRTSIMQYKSGERKSLTAIAHELNVDAILEGTVAHAGEKVRITAQLIRAHNDQHLWSQKYERPVTDILSLQSEVARAIAAEVEATLSPQEQTYLARSRPVNPEAYDAFLKGKFFLHQGIRGVSKSIEFFKQAIALDSVLAEYHAGLAEALCYARIFGFRGRNKELESVSDPCAVGPTGPKRIEDADEIETKTRAAPSKVRKRSLFNLFGIRIIRRSVRSRALATWRGRRHLDTQPHGFATVVVDAPEESILSAELRDPRIVWEDGRRHACRASIKP